MSGDIRDHYDRLAGTYDENWEHSPEFLAWMSGCIIRRLCPLLRERAMDLGCGTGLFSRALAEQTGQVVCIDPSARMLGQLPADDAFIPVQASAEDLVAGKTLLPHDAFDAILIKEAVHHVTDRETVLRGLAGLLAPGGRILIVMLPLQIEYPLFDAALKVFEELQPDPVAIASTLERAGLEVRLEYEAFPLAFTKQRYLSLVRNRYMSLLSMFDDAELERGIAEINRTHPEDPLLFSDRFAFILGHRP